MSKHSTTPRTLSRRLAALLAALALLAAMALPVYAEAQTEAPMQTQETVDTGTNANTGTDADTGNEPETNEGTDTGTGAESEDTNDNASLNPDANSTTPADDAANDTPQTLPADNIDTTAGKTTMDDTPDTMDEDEDAKQDSVTQSTDDAETADDAATDNGTAAYSYPAWVYVAVADGFEAGWTVRFNSNKVKDGNDWLAKQRMAEQKTLYDGRRVFGFELTKENCPNDGYSTIQFLPWNGNNQQNPIYEASNKWMPINEFANKLYDAKKGEWVDDYKPFDPTDHTAFKEKTMAFKNAAATDLTNVVAHFYEKTNGKLVEVEAGTHNLGTVSAGNTVPFTIPTAACSYVQFTAGDNKIISSLYNFYGQEVGTGEESFLFDETNCFCFVYTEKASNWTKGSDGRTICYDATFSKPSLDTANAIPSIVGGDVYYYLTGPNKEAQFGKMTRQSDDLYYIDGVADDYDHIIFAARSTGDNGIKPDNLARSGESTANLEIPWANGYAFPCFYADTGDDSTYKSDANNQRDGYWAEVNTLRNAEANKAGKTVVDVPQERFKADSSTKYIDTTLYDYYSDWELNGNNRDTYDHKFSEDGNAPNAFSAHRNWVPFRQFDQAVSDYYLSAGAFGSNNSVLYPIYTGHFQPQEFSFKPFAELSGALNLFGFTNGRAFMAANNSALCAKTDDNRTVYYDYTFQGIVADKEVNGQPIMRGTENGTNKLVEPHFNEDFLKGNNSKKAKLGNVYENVSFPFTQADVFGEKVKYWAFDAADTTLYLKQDSSDSNSYFLQKSNDRTASENRESNTTVKKDNKGQPTYGFFPFNETIPKDAQASNYNYGFGAKLQFNFTLTENGKVKSDEGGEDVPIKFFFSGDDDVWVFIDGKLVLDVGGAHGKASGLLEFGASGDKNIVTPYVSKVKVGGTANLNSGNLGNSNDWDNRVKKTIIYQGSNNKNEQIDFYYAGDTGDTIEYDKGKTHTLTMYYMERGMWESNMAIAFNFPDYNELQVKKEVNVNGVNDLFKNCFTDKRLFNFTIRNQATHYGTTDAKGDTVTTINLLEPNKSTPDKKDFTTTATHAPGTSGENRFIKVNSPPDDPSVTDGTPLLNWYTQFEDLTPSPGSNKDKRYGILTLDKPIDITGMSYLSFDVYVDSKEGDAALSNMYLQLRDSKGHRKGCLDQTFIGGKDLYGQVEMHNNRWITVKLSLDDVKADEGFDEKRVKELRFGCNYPRSIYLRNIMFSSKAVPQTVTGFTTEQKDIADYGSAQKGELMPAVNAQYTSDAEKGTMVVDKNGGFVLKTGETISFKDQFRRGSYLSINEQVDKNLFDTHWTIYEDGKAVNETKEGTGSKLTLDGGPISLKDRPGTAPDDGRIENKDAEGEGKQSGKNQNAYDGQKPSTKIPNDNTIVFRSYANPDATDADGETQLKVVFVNTVKTGSLTIKKEQDGKGESLTGKTYMFRVRFTNVGGHALEDEAIVETYPVTVDKPFTIDNIPVGTRFTIEELTPEDGSKLTNASVTGGGSGTMVLNDHTVRGSIVADKENQAVATFTNTKQETLDITGTKEWRNADDSPMTEHPATIYVQLQCRRAGETSESSWTPVTYLNETYTKVKQDHKGMNFSFLGLPAKDYSNPNKPNFEYRVVEGSVDNKGVFQAVDDEKTITIGEKVYSVTYKYTDSKPDAANTNNAKQTVTITNTQQDPKFTLDVTKKSAENDGENDQQKLLAGVEFTLEKMKDDGNGKLVVDGDFNKLTGVTNAQGVLKLKDLDGNETQGFTELKAGTYRLTETKAAENYNLLSAPILVTFDRAGTCKLNGSKIEVSTTEKRTEFTKNEDGSYTLALTVLNRKTPALPHTGADAPSLWLLIGLPLAVAGLLILVFRYNKKGGRTR
ncbi:MAG: SpaA isopeptide-forming pilin-related protein [Gemmiger sp.]|uniref:SpaA isopeptide-forming pilin-related protein n=1 Tax=Gemmiger sp. TaxID=2049027 RepID=UPI00300EF7F3